MTATLTKHPERRDRDRYVDDLVEAGSSLRLPELCGRSVPDALYRVPNRGGLNVVALAQGSLTERQLDSLSRFRFAQYLAAGFIDLDVAFGQQMDHDVLRDPGTPTSADTVHFIVTASGDGHLLASMCLVALDWTDPGVRVASRDRMPFQVEEHYGWGVFNRLALIPDTPVNRVREFGRLVKNPRYGSAGVGSLAVIELCMAASRMLLGTLATTVDVCIGEFETNGVRRTLAFFHTPMVVLRGGLPVFAPGHPLNAALDGRDRYPFAFLVSDLASMASRLDAIELALAAPGSQALARLAELKRIPYDTPSALVPPAGIPTLADTALAQRSTALPARRRARELGSRLRRFPAFAQMSDTECTTLRSLAVEADIEAGCTILRRNQIADELVLIEDGRAEQRLRGRTRLAGLGDCIGAAGVLAGAKSPSDIVAHTPMRVLRLPADTFLPLLRELPDVELELQRVALDELRSSGSRGGSRLATDTAEAMAALRAAGAADRDPALRNPDYMARAFLTPQLRVHALARVAGVRRLIPAIAERLAPGSYHYEAARVKHIDAILRHELREGLEQLVILGAGYDSRPYRFASALDGARIFEVDLPVISDVKRRKVARASGRQASHVTFIEADFKRDDVHDLLRERGHDPGAATLIILSGVAPYLPEPAVVRLFAFAARHTSPRSSIVFDYVFREMIEGDDSFHGAAQTRKRLAALGEPLRFGIPAGGAEPYLKPFGLTLVGDYGSAELAGRYLRDANGTVRGEPYGFAAIAQARTASQSLPQE